MSQTSEIALFEQLAFIRGLTWNVFDRIPVAQHDVMPAGFRNHIRWQLAHVLFVMERFAFQLCGQPFEDHDILAKQYGNGSTPHTWDGSEMSVDQLKSRYSDQIDRVRAALIGKLDEPLLEPYQTANGAKMNTPRELMTYAVFHEGMHLSVIKMYSSLLK